MRVDHRRDLSRGARLTHRILRGLRPLPGGLRRMGRKGLARRLGCSDRQVTRYTGELVAAELIERVPPRRVRTADGGWRCAGVNAYRMIREGVRQHRRRSDRGDTGVTPPPKGVRGDAPAPVPRARSHEYRPDPDVSTPPGVPRPCVCGFGPSHARHR